MPNPPNAQSILSRRCLDKWLRDTNPSSTSVDFSRESRLTPCGTTQNSLQSIDQNGHTEKRGYTNATCRRKGVNEVLNEAS